MKYITIEIDVTLYDASGQSHGAEVILIGMMHGANAKGAMSA